MATVPEATVIEAIAQLFEDKGLSPPGLEASTRLEELGLDSLDFAELVVRLEARFGADPFAQGAPPRVSTIAQLARLYDEGGSTVEVSRAGAAPSSQAR